MLILSIQAKYGYSCYHYKSSNIQATSGLALYFNLLEYNYIQGFAKADAVLIFISFLDCFIYARYCNRYC